ncbi:RidA family protein [Sulfurimonas sp.]|jgi:2-iminobutanoate/2-iminopropanoate deaminase|uniref:RidA family protein n=1 Tax=Sulfurimonas sp. TaxID=2022749 RepID=UPI0025DB424E|nr:RidA family protein [Sulfurimonas sp.]MCK9473009.1 RidA family protein [Sulfurimonas sp.]MDD3506166.1 RidA family protein [Sulfurimonas sp.]
MKFVQTNKAPAAIGPYSQAVVANGMVFTSGQIALTLEGVMLENDVVVQTKQVLKNLQAVLEEAGASMSSVIKTTIFLASMDDFTTVNEIYAQAFGSHKPVRSTVAVKTLPKNALVEIDAIALVK